MVVEVRRGEARVRGVHLDRRVRDRGTDVSEDTQDMDGVGRFGWVTDPEGNRIELWQQC